MTAAATILHLSDQRDRAQKDRDEALRQRDEIMLTALQAATRSVRDMEFRHQVLAVMREDRRCKRTAQILLGRIERIIRNEVGV